MRAAKAILCSTGESVEMHGRSPGLGIDCCCSVGSGRSALCIDTSDCAVDIVTSSGGNPDSASLAHVNSTSRAPTSFNKIN